MPIVALEDIEKKPFQNGAIYQTIVGDDAGSTPIRVGVQTAPSGFSTGTHSHPYLEVVSVIEGQGEAWIEGQDGVVEFGPGTILVLPAGVKHGFRATGPGPLKTYGVHASPTRIVERHPEADARGVSSSRRASPPSPSRPRSRIHPKA
jgi:mannose-6-phosphate isomerase-like protein (cupin superfamily)